MKLNKIIIFVILSLLIVSNVFGLSFHKVQDLDGITDGVSYYYVNKTYLTNETQTLQEVLSQGNTATLSITTTGNVTASSFIGDGSQLTGIPSYWNETNGHLTPINQSNKLKVISPSSSLPDITGSLNFIYVNTEDEGYETGDYEGEEQNLEVWGYKDFGAFRVYTSNSLTDVLYVDDCPYEYVEVELTDLTATITNNAEYDGYLVHFTDSGEGSNRYSNTNAFYWNDEGTTSGLDSTSNTADLFEVAGEPITAIFTGISGDDL